MTISTTEPRISYVGNGSTTSFAVTFDFDADADLQVDLVTTATGDVTLQTLTTHYTISGSNVVMVTAPAATETLVITLGLDFDQSTNLVANGPFAAETVEDAFDELSKQIKEVKEDVDRRVPKLPTNLLTTSTATDTNIKANYSFTINSNADGIELQDATTILDINSLTAATPGGDDEFLFADSDDSYNIKKVSYTSLVQGLATAEGTALIEVDGAQQNTGAPTLDFDGTDFTLTESPDDDFDITIKAERIQDIVGAMVTGNTETNIAVTYEDSDGTLDFVVSDSFLLNTGDVGTGTYDFGGADDFEIPNSATPTVDTAGQIAVDTTITDHTGLITYHDGTEALYVIAIPTGNLTTTDSHVISYNATNNEFEMVAGGAGGGVDEGKAIALQMVLK